MGVYTSVNFYPVHLLVSFEEMAKVFLIQFQYKLNIIIVVSKMFVEYQFSTKGDVRNINETTLFLYIGITQVYLDFTFHPLKKKESKKRGGGYLINQSNRLHIMQWVLSNLDFIKRGKREHT